MSLKLDPRTKLILVLLFIVALFSASSWLTNGLVLIVTVIQAVGTLIAKKNTH